jgi:hypothetical protein
MNYGKIQMTMPDGKVKKISSLKNYLIYRGQNPELANPKANKLARKKRQAAK